MKNQEINQIIKENNEDKVFFDGGKYTIKLIHNPHSLSLLRHGEAWVDNGDVHYSKMLISIMYEVSMLRKLLSDVAYDFNPDKGELGPRCGPEILKRIKAYEEHFNVDLRYVEDINE